MNEKKPVGNKITVLGKRVLVEKERIDSGAMMLTPTMEADGEKNKGVILAVGQIGLKAEKLGLKPGVTILFKKFFTPNYVEGEEPLVFVDVENILAIL